MDRDGIFESPIKLTVKSTWKEHANTMQKDASLGFEPNTYLLEGNIATSCTVVISNPNPL